MKITIILHFVSGTEIRLDGSGWHQKRLEEAMLDQHSQTVDGRIINFAKVEWCKIVEESFFKSLTK